MKKALSLFLVALMLIGMLPMTAAHVHAAETATSSMAVKGTTGVLSSDKSSISWTDNKITFTNYKDKSQTAIRNSDSGHYRVYKSSKVEITAPGNITKIVITSTGGEYDTAWVNSVKAVGTASKSGSVITIVPTTPATTISFSATAQARLTKIEVTYEVAGGSTGCAHTNVNDVAAVDATCTTPGYTAGKQCADCEAYTEGHEVVPATGHSYGDWETVTAATCTEAGEEKATCANCGDEKTQTVAAKGHIYENGVCTGCGHVAVMTQYELVTDASSLKSGDTLIIVGVEGEVYSAMLAYKTGDNNVKTEVIPAPVDGKLSLPDTSAAAVITLDGDSNGWTLFDGTNYLYSAGTTKSNHLKGKTELPTDSTGNWTIVIDADGKATITSIGNTGDGARNVIKFNYGNTPDLFSCYKVDYTEKVDLVYIYRLTDGEAEEQPTEPDTTPTVPGEGETTTEYEGEMDKTDPSSEPETSVPESSEPEAEAGYVLADSILIGDKIVIVSKDAGMELTAISTTSTKYGVGTAYTDVPAATWEFTVVAGNTEGTYALVDANGNYLNWTSSNTLNTSTTLSKNTSWSISIDENGYAHIKNAADSARQIWWNIQSPRFAAYTGKSLTDTGYNGLNIYKYSTGEECEHEWGEWIVTTAPKCTEAGVATSTCALCKAEQTKSVDATGHTFTYADGAMACTCGETVQLNTIAEAKAYTSTSQVYYLKGIVTYVNADKVYIEDETGAILVFFDKTVDTSGIKLGDELVVWDTMTKYNNLIETTYTLSTEYMIVSEGNELPLQVVTIEQLLADTTNEYLAERVVIENVTIGTINTSGDTSLTDADGNSIDIYKVSGLSADINENDTVSATVIVSTYNGYQLLVNPGTAATDVVETTAGEETVVTTVTIAEAKAGTAGEYYQVEGTVTYISGRNVYIQDATGGIVVYLTANAATTQVGDTVKAYGTLKVYNGLIELDGIDETNTEFYSILSNGNTVASQDVTIEGLLADTSNEYLAEKVILSDVYVSYFSFKDGTVTYTLNDGNGNEIKIYKVAVADEASCYAAGTVVDVEAVVSSFNGYQLVTDHDKILPTGDICDHSETTLVVETAATCTTDGVGNKQCNVCGYYVEKDVVIPATGHTEVVDAPVAATCTSTGLTEGSHCSVCNTVLVAQTEVPMADHTEVVDAPVAATCTSTGLTEGKHCSVCNTVLVAQTEVPMADHAFVDGVCGACGAADPDYVPPVAEPTVALEFQTASLTLANSLAINFKAYKEIADEYTDLYAIFTMNGKTVRVDEYYVSGKYIVFDFPGIAANHMNSVVSAVLYGKAKCNGQDYVSTKNVQYGVYRYCQNMLGKYWQDPAEAKFCTAMVDLLNYGAAAQLYNNYKTDNLANNWLNEGQKALATQNTPAMESVQGYEVEIENPKVTFSGASLVLDSAVVQRIRVNINVGDVSDYTYVVRTENGKTWTYTAEDLVETDATDAGVKRYYIYMGELFSTQMSTKVFYTVYEGDTIVSHTFRYSTETFAYKYQDSTNPPHTGELLVAMIKYGNAVKAYAG